MSLSALRRSDYVGTARSPRRDFPKSALQRRRAAMKKTTHQALAAAILFLAMTTPLSRSWAQGWSKVEIGTGYSYSSVDPNIGGSSKSDRINSNGAHVHTSIGLTPWLAAEFNYASAIHSESDTLSIPGIIPV